MKLNINVIPTGFMNIWVNYVLLFRKITKKSCKI